MQLVTAGWEIGAHTRSRLSLTTVASGAEGNARVIAELLRGKVHIERHLGGTAGDSTEFRHCASVTQTFPRGR
jgi:peptidoglycan/xylan/chitin deacetylase (PgdA/CDA1 family)